MKDINEIIDEYGLEEDMIILEPQSDFNDGIIDVTEDRYHLVYSYEKLTRSLTKSYKEFEKDSEKTDDDYTTEAIEWLDYNTIRSLPYMNQDYVPIIINEI